MLLGVERFRIGAEERGGGARSLTSRAKEEGGEVALRSHRDTRHVGKRKTKRQEKQPFSGVARKITLHINVQANAFILDWHWMGTLVCPDSI